MSTPRRSRRTRVAACAVATVLATVLALGAAACSDGSTPAGGSTDTPTANGALSTGLAQPPTELVRVAGTVVAGIEPGCLLLDTGFTKYVLIGGDQAALALSEENEEEITVTGQANSPKQTPCTGGTPLEIQQVIPAT